MSRMRGFADVPLSDLSRMILNLYSTLPADSIDIKQRQAKSISALSKFEEVHTGFAEPQNRSPHLWP